jgi:hypothetical protein
MSAFATTNSFVGATISGWFLGAAPTYPSGGIGIDFYDNGDVKPAVKKPLDISAYKGICITYATSVEAAVGSEGAWRLTLKQTTIDNNGQEWYSDLTPATGLKAFFPFTGFAQPDWVKLPDNPPTAMALALATGLELSAKDNGKASMSELGLALTAAECTAGMTQPAPNLTFTVAAASSGAVVSSGVVASSAVVKSSAVLKSSSSAAKSSASTAILAVAATADFGITNVNKNAVSFFVQDSRMVSLDAFDLMGNRVANLYKGMAQGNMSAQFNGKSLKQGVYMIRLTSGSDVRMVRTTVAR